MSAAKYYSHILQLYVNQFVKHTYLSRTKDNTFSLLNLLSIDEIADFDVSECVSFLLLHVQRFEEEGKKNYWLSCRDIAELLLKWCVQEILKQSGRLNNIVFVKLIWRTLEICLRTIIGRHHFAYTILKKKNDFETDHRQDFPVVSTIQITNNAHLSQILTQSVLHKLIPEAARLGFVSNGELEKIASVCFSQLMILYRPTMDHACIYFIPFVNELVMQQLKPYFSEMTLTIPLSMLNPAFLLPTWNCHKLNIIHDTILLLCSLQRQEVTNPKKMFSLLSSTTVLNALARFHRITTTTDTTFICGDTMKYVREMMWKGFFQMEYHLEGYRMMKMFTPIVMTESICVNNEDSIKKRKRTQIVFKSNIGLSHQVRFFSTLEDLTQDTVKSDCAIEDAVYIIFLLPILVDGFFKHTHKIEQRLIKNLNYSCRKTCISKEAIQELQLVYWSCIVTPIIDHLSKCSQTCSMITSSLESLQRCLTLFLEADVYRPSSIKINTMIFLSLSNITHIILILAENNNMNTLNKLIILHMLIDLVQMNHLFIHERLHRLFCVVVQSLLSSKLNNAIFSKLQKKCFKLLSSIVRTYTNLRRLDYFISVGLLNMSNEEFKTEPSPMNLRDTILLTVSVDAIKVFLHNRDLNYSISSGVRVTPLGQIRIIWKILNKYILKQISLHQSKQTANYVRVIIRLFVLIINAIPIFEQGTASEIQQLCNESMNNLGAALLGDHKLHEHKKEQVENIFDLSSPLTHEGLRFYDCITVIYSECCFYLNTEIGNSSLLTEHNSIFIIKKLFNTVNFKLNDDPDGHFLGAIQQLCYGRIQHLHSIINAQRKSELSEDGEGEKNVLKLIQEAKLLTCFIINSMNCRSYSKNRTHASIVTSVTGYKRIAQHFVWISYSEPHHVTYMLRWLFFTLAVDKNISNHVLVDPTKCPIPCNVFNEERFVALSLLQDASFFEVKNLSDHSVLVGWKCAMELIIHGIFDMLGTQDSSMFYGADYLFIYTSDIPLTPQQWTNALTGTRKLKYDLQGKCTYSQFLHRAHWLIMLMNSLPSYESITFRSTVTRIIDKILRVHLMMYMFLCGTSSSSDLIIVALKILSICQLSLAKTFSWIKNDDYSVFGTSGVTIQTLINYTWAISMKVDSIILRINECKRFYPNLLSNGGELLGEILVFCIQRDDRAQCEHCNDFINGLKVVAHSQDTALNDHRFFKMKILFIKPTIRKMISLSHAMSHTTVRNVNSKYESNIRKVYNEIIFLMNNIVRSIVNVIANGINTPKKNQCDFEFVVFIADILRLWKINNSSIDLPFDIHTIKVINKLTNIALQHAFSNCLSGQTTWLYFLCSLSSIISILPNIHAVIVLQEQIPKLVSHNYIYNVNRHVPLLLRSAYVAVIHSLKEGQVRHLAETLTTKTILYQYEYHIDTYFRIASSVYCFHMILLVVKEPEHCLKDIAQTMIDLTLNIYIPQCRLPVAMASGWEPCILTAQNFLSDILAKKNVIFLSGYKIANIITRLGFLVEYSFQPKITNLNAKIYCSSCDVLISLIKYYPKQLYGCSPIFVDILSLYFQLIMIPIPDNDLDTRKRIQSFVKLCWFLPPHKDVFRKYLMGLIIDFIDGMQTGMEPIVKSGLMPAVYVLLDIFSKYEIQALISIMDNSSRSMFKTVFKLYQKKHLYKGQ